MSSRFQLAVFSLWPLKGEAMDVDSLLAIASKASASSPPAAEDSPGGLRGSFLRARARLGGLTRVVNSQTRGARDCVHGSGIRGAELRAQLAWTNRRKASTKDYQIEICDTPTKRWKGEGSGSWKHRTAEQICEIIHASRPLQDLNSTLPLSTRGNSGNQLASSLAWSLREPRT